MSIGAYHPGGVGDGPPSDSGTSNDDTLPPIDDPTIPEWFKPFYKFSYGDSATNDNFKQSDAEMMQQEEDAIAQDESSMSAPEDIPNDNG